MPSDQFEKKLRQRLEGAEMLPSPDLWAAIAEQVAPPPSKRRGAFWWWLDGTALLLIAALWLWPASPLAEVEAIALGTGGSQVQNLSLPEATPEAVLAPELSRQTPPVKEVSTQHPLEASVANAGTSEASQLVPPTLVQPAAVPQTNPPKSSVNRLAFPNPPHSNSLESSLEQPLPSAQERGLAVASAIGQIDRWEARPNQLSTAWSREIPAHQPMDPADWRVSPWKLRLRLTAGMSPTANGWVWNSQVHSPDIRANYSRSLGVNQVAEEEIHLFRLPNRKLGLQASIEYQFSPRLSLESGVQLMQSSWGTYEKGSISGEQPIGPTLRDPLIEVENQYEFRLSQWEVPLLLNAHFYPGGRHISVSTGLLLGHTNTWQVQEIGSDQLASEDRALRNANQETILSVRPWYGQAIGQLNYYLSLRPGQELFVGPIARYQLTGQYGGLQAAGQARYLLGFQAGLRLQR